MKVIPQLEECGSFTLLQIMSSVHLLSKGRNRGAHQDPALNRAEEEKVKEKKKQKKNKRSKAGKSKIFKEA